MIDDPTSRPAPTVESNSSAARLACQNERDRVLNILALAEPPLLETTLRAIEQGLPAAQAKRRIENARAATANTKGSSEARSRAAPRQIWTETVRRFNDRRRAVQANDEPAGGDAA